MRKIFTKLIAAASVGAIVLTSFGASALAALTVQVSGVSNGASYNTDVRPSFSAAGATSLSATLNGGTVANNTLIGTEGSYLLTITAVGGGNVTFKDVRFAIDKTAPVISISGVTNGQTYTDQSVRPYFSTNEGALTATLNGGTIANGTLISTVGDYLLTVTAADAAGNVTFRNVRFALRKSITPPVNPPVTPPTTPETPGTPATPVPTNGTTKTVKGITKIAKAVTVPAAPTETCAVPCPDPMDAILKDVSVTKIENADGLGGNLNSCRNVRITGHAQDGLLVILYIKKEGTDVPLIGFVKAGAGDEYRFTTDKPLAEGTYTVFAKLAQEGGKTGPMIEVGHFQVEKCSRWLVWLWLLIILIALIVGSVIGWLVSRRRRRNAEARATDDMKDMDEDALSDEIVEEATDEMDSDRL